MRNYSEAVASMIDKEVESIILAAYKRTEEILRAHLDKLHAVAAALVEREKIDAEEFNLLMEGKELPPMKKSEPPKTEKAETADGEPAAKDAEADSAEAPNGEAAEPTEAPDTASADAPAEDTAESDSDSPNP